MAFKTTHVNAFLDLLVETVRLILMSVPVARANVPASALTSLMNTLASAGKVGSERIVTSTPMIVVKMLA